MNDPEGLREFINARSAALVRTGWLLTGDWALAEDLVQTALAKTWPKWEQLAADGSPEMYVRRVMVNTYATWWRRRRRREVVSAEIPETTSPVDAFSQVDLRAVVHTALRGLPTRQRATVVLRFMDDLTEAQTAEMLGCSVGTVKSQTSKALAHLRQFPAFSDVVREVGHDPA